MALNKAQLAADLQAILADGQAGAKTQAQVAQAIADAIDSFVRAATVTVTVASVTGVTPGGGASGPGTGTGTIS
jgi:hypothetical protein